MQSINRAALAAISLFAGCGDSATGSGDPTPSRLFVSRAPSASAVNRTAFAIQPIVQLRSASNEAVELAGVLITASIKTGPGSLQGATTAVTDDEGKATFTDLAIGGVAGAKTLAFNSEGLTEATATITTTAGAATSIVLQAGDAQTEAEGIAVPVRPAVKAMDIDGNAKSGVSVTFSIVAGGGTLGAPVQNTDAAGVAAVGSWAMGAAGAQSLLGSATGLGSVAFTATSLRLNVASVVVTAPSASMIVNTTLQMTATPQDSVGRPLAGRTIVWSSNDQALATISVAGLVTGKLPGSPTMSAVSEGKTGTRGVTVNAPTLALNCPGGSAPCIPSMNGHFGSQSSGADAAIAAGYMYGFSYYTAVHALQPALNAGVQLGWGTWMLPNNWTFTQPLCPVGTYARDNWPERGPTYRDVYQTVEGGVGAWVTTRFPTSHAKYRINSTPDCYSHQVSTPGYGFGWDPLPESKLGLAQLSNRLLLPPDGFTFNPSAGMRYLGNGWLALPLIPAYTAPSGVPTGGQSWTVFITAGNFRGPVAFWTPEVWSRVNMTDPTGIGRGLDAVSMWTGGPALEVGEASFFTSEPVNGVRYRRIPRISFPADVTGQSALIRDVRFYSKTAIWFPVAGWMDGAAPVTQFVGAGVYQSTVTGSGLNMRLGGDPVALNSSFTSGGVAANGGGSAFALTWTAPLEFGVLPEYYKEGAGSWTPVPKSQVPRETWLEDQTFPLKQRSAYADLNTGAGSPWAASGFAAGPFSASLNDGSVVQYVWYKFIDQPAITRLQLSAAVRNKLQAWVESLHETAGVSGVSIVGPGAGTLASLDPAQIVTPPAGLAKGYVPIVISQR